MSVTYSFPRIEHLDDVRVHVDADCFRVVEKDSGHTFVNYVKMGNDTFPAFPAPKSDDPWDIAYARSQWQRAAVRRECRGIAFDTETGAIVSRPFHKFFNVGEREDMDVGVLDFSARHWVLDKLDGSMVRPLPTPAGIRWGTKMGITDTAMWAEDFVAGDKRDYVGFAEFCISHGWTPMFEYVGPFNRIVAEYAEDMVLLAIRHNREGWYLTPEQVDRQAELFGIPTVRTYDPVEGDPTVYLSAVKESDDLDEGIVIQWENGHRAKVKTDIYSTLHRVKEASRTERTLVTAIREGTVDDLLPLVSAEDRADVEAYIKRFWWCFERLRDDIAALYKDARLSYDDKKSFAISPQGAKSMTRLEASLVFSMWDGKIADASEAADRVITGGLVSETKWQEMKENVAMAANLNNFETAWKEKGDFE